MRTTLLALALVLVACGRSERAGGTPSAADAPPAIASTDQLVLRVPRAGGRAAAYAYPALDSALWRSDAKVPGLERVLAFDDEAGAVAAVDSKGVPVRIDLRLGSVARETRPALSRVTSSDGWAIYGITKDGKVARLTPGSAAWTYTPPAPARELFPQPDGSLLVLSQRGGESSLRLLHPPESKVMHTAELPRVQGATRTQAGDRVYFTVDSGLIAVRGRDLAPVPSIRLQHHARAIVTTPSGDRVYVAVDSTDRIVVVDRYAERIAARIPLPGTARDLRMDPTGRYLLARPSEGDSVWVIAIGTERVLGAAPSAWRGDLPAVAPDGQIALLRGADVVFVDGETLAPKRRIAGGGGDLWYFFTWNGFRRPKPAEEPPPAIADTAPAAEDSASENPFAGQLATQDSATAELDTASAPPPVGPPPTAPVTRPSTSPARRDTVRHPALPPEFTVQFAALRDEDAARDLVRQVRSGPASPRIANTVRVSSSVVAGRTIYRVVAGPFRARDEAERAAQATGKSYWIYEGAP
ncbi:MAG TPA: SPOR domain-containing protein [Gemmatimonadaceae bacterium]|nr:SPOR domain-containing protein [Gemmatimonadaceae bacterium]